jgi:hypothetical protein
MEPSSDGRFLYIGGEFRTVDGIAANRLVKYDLVNNRVDTTFKPAGSMTRVTDLQLVNGRLFVAGVFPGGIKALDPTTGALQPYFDSTQAAGQETGYTTRVYRFSINPAGTRMVVLGSFTSVGGQARQQAAVLALGPTAALVSPWYSDRWDLDCYDSLRWYTRDVDWSVDGNHFAIVTSGGGTPGTPKLCDTVTWWKNADLPKQQPVWINYSGGDTFHSVAVTDKAVFVSGHQRWLDNPEGRDFAGPGAVSRRGLGAIDLVTGKATSWNPTKSTEGGRGGYDLYFTSGGLWVGHFENRISTELHEGIGLLPF